MPDITDDEIKQAAQELFDNIPEWSKKLMTSELLINKTTRLALPVGILFHLNDINEACDKLLTNQVASISIGYVIGYKHAKTETLQKI